MMRFAAIFLVLCGAVVGLGKDELARSTWETPSHDEVRAQVEAWLAAASVDVEQAERIRQRWDEPVLASARLDLLGECLALASERNASLMELCRSSYGGLGLPDWDFLSSSETPPFERHHLRLIYGRWLAQNELYNETLEQIGELKPADVIAPSMLLFYQSVAHHRLLQKEACLPVVEQLLENEDELPRRFSTLAKLIRADIEPLETDSLDEISRLMDSIKVRLGHGRAGTRVRKEEDDVIAKLDKMIKKLEEQAQSQSSSSSGGQAGDALNPAAPMSDSLPGGAKGPGNVDSKNIAKKDGWGNLPPKEREQALQQLGKDFPSHYRDVIEEYFRKLAQDGDDGP